MNQLRLFAVTALVMSGFALSSLAEGTAAPSSPVQGGTQQIKRVKLEKKHHPFKKIKKQQHETQPQT